MLAPRKTTTQSRRKAKKPKTRSRRKNRRSLSRQQVKSKIEAMRSSGQLLLPQVFDDQTIRDILTELGHTNRKRIFTPEITVALFVQQVLSEHCGCQKMLHEFNKQRKRENLCEVSADTSSYCAARRRVPLELFHSLMDHTVDLVQQNGLPSQWLWNDRRVILVDGHVVRAPDTPENQEVFPQPCSQKAGLGFPQVRQTVAICLATGVVLNVKCGPVEGKKTGEATQFRQMMSSFRRGDIIVADSNFECYRDLATLKQQGADMVCCINGSRTSPFTGKCLAVEDKSECVAKPKFNAKRFTREEWEALPENITIRIIRYPVGGRNESITIVTTLLDRETYPAEEVANLYGHRWDCELDIRSIKTVMGMGELACHSPEMIEREILAYYLAYNIVRVAMADAARVTNLKPRRISFKSAKNAWLSFGRDGNESNDYAWLLWSIAQRTIGHRPGRQEPRKVKRRDGKYERMKMPRAQEKQAIGA